MSELSEQDVVDVLTADHREVETLIADIQGASTGGDRRDLADVLIAELVRHSVAEEMHVYPAMKKHLPDGEEAVAHDVEEHKELEKVMKELEAADPDGPGFLALVNELSDILRDHVQDEEKEQFPKLRAAVSRQELVDIAGKVETAKKAAPTRPHPSSPN